MALALRTFALVLALGTLHRAQAVRADAFTSAAEHYREKRWDRACEEFARLLREQPDHARRDDVQFFYGEALAQLGRWREARQQFTALLERRPAERHARQALFRAGEAAYMLGDDSAAARELSAFRAKYPSDSLDAYVLPYLGSLQLHGGETANAETSFAESLERFPDGPLAAESRLGLAQARHQSGRLEEAAASYRQVIASTGPLAEQASLQLAAVENARGNYQAALDALDQFAARFPTSALAARERLGRGYALYGLERYEDARAVLDDVVGDPALGVEAAYWRALSRKDQQQWDAAAEELTRLAIDKDHRLAPAVAFHRADALRLAGKFDDAGRMFDEAAAQFADSAWADDCFLGRVRVAVAQDDQTGALASADRLIANYVDSPLLASAKLAKGQALLALDRADEAVAVLKPLVDQASSAADDQTLKQHARASLAVAQAKGGDFDAARASLAQLTTDGFARELAAETAYQVAELASAAGQTELAERLYASVAGDRSQQLAHRAQSGLAWNHFEAGRWMEAAAAFDALLASDPNGPLAAEAALLRGVSLEKLERFDDALAMYDNVVSRFAGSSRVNEARFRAARLHERLGQNADAKSDYANLIAAPGEFAELDAALYRYALLLLPTSATSAHTHLERLVGEFPSSRFAADARLRLAERAVADRRFDEAEKWLGQFDQSEIDDELRVHGWYLSGQLEIARERWTQAAEVLTRLLEKLPDDDLASPATYLLAEAEFRQGQFEQAADRLAKLAEATSDRDDEWLAQAELRRAQALAQLKRWSESADVARGIADRFPDFDRRYDAEYLVGRAYAAQADFASARAWYAKVIARVEATGSETRAMAQWMQGESFFHQENYAEALAAYLQVDATHPRWHAAALLQAGKCQEQLGRWQEAAEAYARLLADHPKSELTSEAARRLDAARQRAERPTTKTKQ
ncbi:MAG: hypothetical protein DWQ37_03980 [Planctomycetota bacterium]|nr:MAG: hypothetical protein DWQ37_03980 [Planctomycetota bacterium]